MERNKSIESLNEELPELFLSDLEERLETDPLYKKMPSLYLKII